ncbi:MAG: hypothetical protein AAF603_04380 [Pseudomonadota bacterium]
MFNDQTIPWIICIVTILCFVIYGLISGRKIDNATDDFLTGGRGFGAVTLSLSIFATSNTGFMFVGAIGAGYLQGLPALWVPVAWLAGEVFFWQFFPERINKFAAENEPVSIPDYISKAVNSVDRYKVQMVAGAVVVFTMLPYIIGQNIAAGKAFSSVADIDQRLGVVMAGGFMSLMAILYCAQGGLKSSMMANALQGTIILIVGALLFFIFGQELLATGAPVQSILATNPDAFNLFAIHPPLILIAFFLGAATASFGSAMSLPTLLMRVSVADSPKELENARWWYLGICYGFWGIMTFIGMVLSGLLPDISDPEQSLFLLAEQISPWVLGLTLAGVSALILSTIDGSTMVGGSAISDDIGRAGNKPPQEKRRLRVMGILAFSIVAWGLGVILSGSSVYQIVLFGVSALAGGIGPAFMITTLGWRTHATALIATILVGVITAILWAVFGLSEYVAEALPSFAAGLLTHWLLTRKVL